METVNLWLAVMTGLFGLVTGGLGTLVWAISQIRSMNEKWQNDLHQGFSDMHAKLADQQRQTSTSIGEVHERVNAIDREVSRLKGRFEPVTS